jgi:hypothetical protein
MKNIGFFIKNFENFESLSIFLTLVSNLIYFKNQRSNGESIWAERRTIKVLDPQT